MVCKYVIIASLFAMIFIQLVSANCTSENDFDLGDNINICTGDCFYQNVSNLSQYIPCDGNTSCFLTSYYPNDTLISAHKNMTWNGTLFNYSLGYLNVTGTYSHKLFCYNQYGEFTKDFDSSITSTSSVTTPSQEGYGAYSNAISYGDYIVCSYVYDFIQANYNSGRINYTTDQLNVLVNNINNQGSDLSSDTIISYISGYNDKCPRYKELPASIQIGILETALTPLPEKTAWEKYRYEIIFVVIIALGILSFEYLKKKQESRG